MSPFCNSDQNVGMVFLLWIFMTDVSSIIPYHPCMVCLPTLTIQNQAHVGKWMFPKIGIPQNGWFIMENPIKMDDLGVP